MNEHIWNVFVQTGNVEAYLILKQLEKNDEYSQYEENNQIEEIKN